MMEQCYNCLYLKFYRGAARGVMDADPDEFECMMENDYFYDEAYECDDYEVNYEEI